MNTYLEVEGAFPPAVSGKEPTSWRVLFLPMIDAGRLFQEYDQTVSWDRPPNSRLASIDMPALRCPSTYYPTDSQGRWFTSYAMLTGAHTIGLTKPHTSGANPIRSPIAEITDGTSYTLAVIESCGSQIVWTEPRDVDVDSRPAGMNLKGDKPGHSSGWLSSYHVGGTNVLMADGSVKFISSQTEPALLKKLATIDGGEDVSQFNAR